MKGDKSDYVGIRLLIGKSVAKISFSISMQKVLIYFGYIIFNKASAGLLKVDSMSFLNFFGNLKNYLIVLDFFILEIEILFKYLLNVKIHLKNSLVLIT